MKFGLIGENLIHSFSQDFFKKKFENLNLKKYQYQNFEIKNVINQDIMNTIPK